jgi:hypothetical protein
LNIRKIFCRIPASSDISTFAFVGGTDNVLSLFSYNFGIPARILISKIKGKAAPVFNYLSTVP